MKNIKHFCTAGPAPLQWVGSFVDKFEKEGWTVRFVLFSGLIQQRLALPGQSPAMPSYAVVAEKMSPENVKVIPPDFESLTKEQ